MLTSWEPLVQGDERLPGRLRRIDLAAGLTAAGFGNVEVRDRPGWRVSERAMWQEAAALDPGDDPALQSFHDEGMRSLEILDLDGFDPVVLPICDARKVFMANRGVWDAIAAAGPSVSYAASATDVDAYIAVAGKFLDELTA